MANTVAEIATLIANKILSGGRRTTAQFVRDVMTPINNSFLNLKDGGNVIESLAGYSTTLTPTDPNHIVPKKYVDDNIAPSYTQEITCDGATTLYTITHNLNTRNVFASICLGQSDWQELAIYAKRISVNAIQYNLGGYDVSPGFKYLITVRK